MSRQPKDPRDLLVWCSTPHPEWHDPTHPVNAGFRSGDGKTAVTPAPSGRRASLRRKPRLERIG